METKEIRIARLNILRGNLMREITQINKNIEDIQNEAIIHNCLCGSPAHWMDDGEGGGKVSCLGCAMNTRSDFAKQQLIDQWNLIMTPKNEVRLCGNCRYTDNDTQCFSCLRHPCNVHIKDISSDKHLTDNWEQK
jgi:hypothetical protein